MKISVVRVQTVLKMGSEGLFMRDGRRPTMRITRVGTAFIAFWVVVALIFSTSSSATEVSTATLAAQASVAGELLVGYRVGATNADRADARSRFNAQLAERVVTPGRQRAAVELVRLPAGLATQAAIRQFTALPQVAFAEPNWIVTPVATSNDPFYIDGSLWGMYGSSTTPANQFGTHASAAWANDSTGSANVYIGVIDEGIDVNHADLAANIWNNPFDPVDGVDNDGNGYTDDVYGWDFNKSDNTVYDGGNQDKHGTHVAGTIGAKGGNGTGVAGVAWNVKMISAKFLGQNGGTIANAIKAVDYLTDLKARHGLNIIATNNSWSGGGYSQALHDAIIVGAKRNILFIAAAGNNGTNNDTTVRYPANYDTRIGTTTQSAASYDAVLSVAAISSNGALASFSNFGAKTVDLGAPGVSILSTLPGSKYGSYSGTSMAAPHVTGAAVLANATSSVTGSSLRDALLSAATATSSLNGKTVTGGRVNVSSFSSGGGSTDAKPSVSITSPSNGSSVSTGSAVTITANASDDKGVTKVDFFVGTTLISTDTTSPYSASWTPNTDGTYNLTARATDTAGQSTTSAAVQVTATTATSPPPDDTATSLTVSAIDYRFYGGKNSNNHLDVSVTVKNDLGQVVAGAAVRIELYRTHNGERTFYGTASGTTNSAGTATFSTKNCAAGVYDTDVTSITFGSLTFDGSEPENTSPPK
jgi:subtilisin family serine protease